MQKVEETMETMELFSFQPYHPVVLAKLTKQKRNAGTYFCKWRNKGSGDGITFLFFSWKAEANRASYKQMLIFMSEATTKPRYSPVGFLTLYNHQ